MENVSRVIAALCGLRRMNQTELGRHLGVGQGAISDKINNHVRWSVWDLIRVAEALDVPVEMLFGDPDDLLRTGSFATLRALPTNATPEPSQQPTHRHLRTVP